MATALLDSTTGKGFLHVRDYNGKPFYEARWSDLERAQRRRRLGPAWVELEPTTGAWCRDKAEFAGAFGRATGVPADGVGDRGARSEVDGR
jgi:hypothetical protein